MRPHDYADCARYLPALAEAQYTQVAPLCHLLLPRLIAGSRIIKDAELEADWLLLSSVRHKPASKVKGGTSDEAGRVGSQVNQGTSQVIRLA